jgi:hypothetical protein
MRMRVHDGGDGVAELPNKANLTERSQPDRTKPRWPNEPNAAHRIGARPAEQNKPRKSNDFRGGLRGAALDRMIEPQISRSDFSLFLLLGALFFSLLAIVLAPAGFSSSCQCLVL